MQPARELYQSDPDYFEQVNQEIVILFAAIKGVICYLEESDDIESRHLTMELYHQFWRLREILEPLLD